MNKKETVSPGITEQHVREGLDFLNPKATNEDMSKLVGATDDVLRIAMVSGKAAFATWLERGKDPETSSGYVALEAFCLGVFSERRSNSERNV